MLQFGTQMITSADGSIGGMLGASPGASTSTTILLDMLTGMFPDRVDSWRGTITSMVPSWGTRLSDDPRAAHESLERTVESLGLRH